MGKITDKILGKIVGREDGIFDEEEYEELKKKHLSELQEEWAKLKEEQTEEPKPEPESPEDKIQRLNEEKSRLEARLEEINTELGVVNEGIENETGYNKLMCLREKRSLESEKQRINERLEEINNELSKLTS